MQVQERCTVNVKKLLSEISPQDRAEALRSMTLEARHRLEDPVQGSIGVISTLQNQIFLLQQRVADLENQITAQGGLQSYNNTTNDIGNEIIMIPTPRYP